MTIIAIIFEGLGGLLILTGWRARFGALLIFLFVIPATYIFHDYWTFPPEEARHQFMMLMKNLSIMGGSLYIMAFGPGGYSFDRK